MSELDNGDEMGRLQRTFALGSPVLVFGPGCHRIGYESTDAWEKVTARTAALYGTLKEPPHRKFLLDFWKSKLSDETRRTIVGDNLGSHSITKLTPYAEDITQREPARGTLAGRLMRALVECTRCLGAVISSGETPVSNWLAVSYDPTHLSESDSDTDDEPDAAAQRFESAKIALELATELAEALHAALQKRSALAPRHRETLIRARVAADLEPALVEALNDMKIDAIAESLRLLTDNCFRNQSVSLSGALVEWLADLLWHVLISGAGVPPSQDELWFYLNLRTYSNLSESGFSRPKAGDLRWGSNDESGEPQGGSLTNDVRGLLRKYDPPVEEVDWEGGRESFALALAASLREIWSDELSARRGGERNGGTKNSGRLVVTLVSDYDLLIERALLSCAQTNERFHVILPVWIGEKPPTLDWVFGTYVRGEGDVSEADVQQPDSWTWLYEQAAETKVLDTKRKQYFPEPVAPPPIGGPIVIKLTGSPLHMLGPNGPPERQEGRPEIATIFSEHHSMGAMISLAQTATRGPAISTLPKQLFGVSGMRGLEWHRRGWLFFGHRFSDWLPRHRLFLAANHLGLARDSAAEDASTATQLSRRSKIAIDRSFEWPERALLKELGISMCRGDLSLVSAFCDPDTKTQARHDKDVADFLANTHKRMRIASSRGGR